MWQEYDFNYVQDLLKVSNEAAHDSRFLDYGRYCELRAAGLRKTAFHALDAFLRRVLSLPLTDRITVVDWIMSRADGLSGESELVPHPLRARLIDPTLAEWKLLTPPDPRPYRWSVGGEDVNDWREAIRLNPLEQSARLKLIKRLFDRVWFSTHEIIGGIRYLGKPEQDFKILDEVSQLIDGLDAPSSRIEAFRNEVVYYHEKINNYLEAKRLLENGQVPPITEMPKTYCWENTRKKRDT